MPITELPPDEWDGVLPLFVAHEHRTAFLFSSLKLRRGRLLAHSPANPAAAMFIYPPICFLAGDAKSPSAMRLVRSAPYLHATFVSDTEWIKLLFSIWQDDIGQVQRTEFSPVELDPNQIQAQKSHIPEDLSVRIPTLDELENADERLIRSASHFFDDLNDFFENGVVFSAFHGDIMVGLASTGHPFEDRFEVHVDTIDCEHYEKYQLARAVSAHLLEYSFMNRLTPNWDTTDEDFIRLAQDLGYERPSYYSTYYRKGTIGSLSE